VDELEDTLERGDKLFLSSKDAVEARTVLAMGVCYSFLGFASESCLTHWTFVPAVSFFDRAKGSAFTESPETSLVDILPLVCNFFPFFFVFSSVFFLGGSLRKPSFLANLTANEDARKALYARVKAEGGEAVTRDLGLTPRPRTSGRTNHDTGPPPFTPSFVLYSIG
jgi:hypothetical protein